MNDCELLELAAKAAGIERGGWYEGGEYLAPAGLIVGRYTWNPLADDGEAMRLAVKLSLSVAFGANYVICGEEQIPTVNNAGDPYAATRRAIVRAAAEIGKATQ